MVQGLLILEHTKNFIEDLHEMQIKFLNPIYADKNIYISKESKRF